MAMFMAVQWLWLSYGYQIAIEYPMTSQQSTGLLQPVSGSREKPAGVVQQS